VSEALSDRHAEPIGLVSGELAESEGAASSALLALANPLSVDHDRLRRSLLPSLLDRAEANCRYGAQSGALFEIGRGYGGGSGGPQEWTRLAVIAWGEMGAAAPGERPRVWDLNEMKRVITLLTGVADPHALAEMGLLASLGSSIREPQSGAKHRASSSPSLLFAG
jgi:phenylalanyl-tRNA synthetase beta subunit